LSFSPQVRKRRPRSLLPAITLTAAQMLTFNVNPALLPRHELGPVCAVAAVAAACCLCPFSALGLPAALILVLFVVWSVGLRAAKTRAAATVLSMGYLLSLGTLQLNGLSLALNDLGLMPQEVPQLRERMSSWGTIFLCVSMASACPRIWRYHAQADRREAARTVLARDQDATGG
jgi:hypothetical protein